MGEKFSPIDLSAALSISRSLPKKVSCHSGRGSCSHIWNIANNIEVSRLKHSDLVATVDISPDGKYVATASDDGFACLWDAKNGEKLGCIKHNSYVNDVNFSPDGKHIVTASADGTAKVWDLSQKRL